MPLTSQTLRRVYILAVASDLLVNSKKCGYGVIMSQVIFQRKIMPNPGFFLQSIPYKGPKKGIELLKTTYALLIDGKHYILGILTKIGTYIWPFRVSFSMENFQFLNWIPHK